MYKMPETNYYAQLKWEDNIPKSAIFDDIYCDKSSGINETKYVFLEHNNLAQRFSILEDNDCFIIGETGFGSGLNFLTTINLWRKLVKSNARLFFISFEKYPLSPQDLQRILANFPEVDSTELISQYYLPLPATHRFRLKNNVYLNLVIGDIQSTLEQHDFCADAWFLDGFTPSKNNDMWDDKIISEIKRHSQINTTFATFTASGNVRRSLIKNGFDVIRSRGFNKWEMLSGKYTGNSNDTYRKPWFAKPQNTVLDKKVIIIGGGIAGAATAYSLAHRGYQVYIYEKNSALALEASGNYQAILYGNFAGNYNPILELGFSGYRYSHNLITKLLKYDYAQPGIIQILENDYQLKQLLKNNLPNDFCYKVDALQIQKLSGLNIKTQAGMYFPSGLWFNPQYLIAELTNHPNIKTILNSEIKAINFIHEQWQIETVDGISDYANNLVLCNSHLINQFIPSQNLPLHKTRGQISIVKQPSELKSIVCGDGYITPNRGDSYTIGATFKEDIGDLGVKLSEHKENIQNISAYLLDLSNQIDLAKVSGQVNIRAHTRDHLPVVGPVANYTKFMLEYAALAKDAKYKLTATCPYLPGLYVNALFGSKGMLYAPVCGEIIADYIENTPFALSENLRQALHPNRFWVKEIISPLK